MTALYGSIYNGKVIRPKEWSVRLFKTFKQKHDKKIFDGFLERVLKEDPTKPNKMDAYQGVFRLFHVIKGGFEREQSIGRGYEFVKAPAKAPAVEPVKAPAVEPLIPRDSSLNRLPKETETTTTIALRRGKEKLREMVKGIERPEPVEVKNPIGTPLNSREVSMNSPNVDLRVKLEKNEVEAITKAAKIAKASKALIKAEKAAKAAKAAKEARDATPGLRERVKAFGPKRVKRYVNASNEETDASSGQGTPLNYTDLSLDQHQPVPAPKNPKIALKARTGKFV
jgi:hypothetical protein